MSAIAGQQLLVLHFRNSCWRQIYKKHPGPVANECVLQRGSRRFGSSRQSEHKLPLQCSHRKRKRGNDHIGMAGRRHVARMNWHRPGRRPSGSSRHLPRPPGACADPSDGQVALPPPSALGRLEMGHRCWGCGGRISHSGATDQMGWPKPQTLTVSQS